MIIPLGYFNLDDNMVVQKGAFMIACLIFLEWMVLFIIQLYNGDYQTLVPIAYFGDAAPVFGVVVFNYAMVTTVPSWCNEKTHATNVNKALSYSIIFGTLLFVMIGVLGGLAFNIPDNGDLLSAIDASQDGVMQEISVFLFPISVVATSIPIYSIIVRYNLLENKICNKPMANFIGVILPWIITIPFYTGQGLELVINWSSLIAGGIINFFIPFWLYVRARQYKMEALSEFDRADIDEQLGTQFADQDEFYCFYKCKVNGGEPAPTHFAFPCIMDRSHTHEVIAYTFMVSLFIALLGVFVINILNTVGVQ